MCETKASRAETQTCKQVRRIFLAARAGTTLAAFSLRAGPDLLESSFHTKSILSPTSYCWPSTFSNFTLTSVH